MMIDFYTNRFQHDCTRIQQNDSSVVEAGQRVWKSSFPARLEAYLDLGRALRHNTYLLHLDLDFSNLYPHHGFAHPLASAIRQSRLQHLELHSIGFAPFLIIHRHGINHSQTIQELSVSFQYVLFQDSRYFEVPRDNDEDFPLAPAMMVGTSLRRLTVEYGNMTESHAMEMAKMIRESPLTHLVLKGTSLAMNIFKILYETGFQQSPATIRDMGLVVRTHFDVDDLTKMLPSLQRLQLFSIGPYPELFQILVEELGNARSLHTLEIVNGIQLTPDLLAAVLGETSPITRLQLSGCGIDDELLAIFVGLWRHDSPLRKLYLNQNTIRLAGAIMLMRAVRNHPALESLDLSGNKLSGFDGVQQVAQELSNLRLRRLSVQDCFPSATCKETAVALINGLESNTYILQLDVFDLNELQIFVAADIAVDRKELALLLTRNKYMHYFVSDDHGLPQTLACHTLTQFKTRSNCIYMMLREHPTLFLNKQVRPLRVVNTQASGEAAVQQQVHSGDSNCDAHHPNVQEIETISGAAAGVTISENVRAGLQKLTLFVERGERCIRSWRDR